MLTPNALLIVAIRDSSYDVVRRLLDDPSLNVDAVMRDHDNTWTCALYQACRVETLTVRQLLDRGASICGRYGPERHTLLRRVPPA